MKFKLSEQSDLVKEYLEFRLGNAKGYKLEDIVVIMEELTIGTEYIRVLIDGETTVDIKLYNSNLLFLNGNRLTFFCDVGFIENDYVEVEVVNEVSYPVELTEEQVANYSLVMSGSDTHVKSKMRAFIETASLLVTGYVLAEMYKLWG